MNRRSLARGGDCRNAYTIAASDDRQYLDRELSVPDSERAAIYRYDINEFGTFYFRIPNCAVENCLTANNAKETFLSSMFSNIWRFSLEERIRNETRRTESRNPVKLDFTFFSDNELFIAVSQLAGRCSYPTFVHGCNPERCGIPMLTSRKSVSAFPFVGRNRKLLILDQEMNYYDGI